MKIQRKCPYCKRDTIQEELDWGRYFCSRCRKVNDKGASLKKRKSRSFKREGRLLLVLFCAFVLLSCVPPGRSEAPEQPYLFVYAENDLTPGFQLRLTNDSVFSWRRVVFVGVSWSNESEICIQYTGTGEVIYRTMFSYQIKYSVVFPGSEVISFQVVIDDTWWNFTDILIARDMALPDDIYWDIEPVMTLTVREYEWRIVEIHIHHVLLSALGCPLGIYLMKKHKGMQVVFKRAGGG